MKVWLKGGDTDHEELELLLTSGNHLIDSLIIRDFIFLLQMRKIISVSRVEATTALVMETFFQYAVGL